jgi:hypothetical protein
VPKRTAISGCSLDGGQPEKSIPYLNTALRLKPGLAAAEDNLKRAQRRSRSPDASTCARVSSREPALRIAT